MRNKALLLTAAFGAFGTASAMAQVYSVNAVGYINVTAPKGFTMFANQLDAGAGNNTVGKLIASVPDGTIIYKFGTSYELNTYEFGEWGNPNMTLAPGEGAWILNPGDAAITMTFVGEVMQGQLSTEIPQGFAIRSSKVPQSATMDALGFPAADGDILYFWRNNSYVTYTYDFGAWDPANPTPAVGESFWTFVGAAKTWNRTFSVNQ
ncbi:MAG: hypothetical protein ACYDC1_18160 [Limisphaerales bacterium]